MKCEKKAAQIFSIFKQLKQFDWILIKNPEQLR